MKVYVVCREGGSCTLVTPDIDKAAAEYDRLGGSWVWIDIHTLDVVNEDPDRVEM